MKRWSVIGVTGMVACVTAACASGARASRATEASPVCAEPYVEIINHTGRILEIYAAAGNVPRLIGEAAPTTKYLSLVGTPLEHEQGAMYATLDGRRVTAALGRPAHTGLVQLIRRCESEDAQ